MRVSSGYEAEDLGASQGEGRALPWARDGMSKKCSWSFRQKMSHSRGWEPQIVDI